MDDIPRNRDRDGWNWLEGRTPAPPGTPSNVVAFPIEPPKHLATAQRIAADAGLLPPVDVAPTDADPVPTLPGVIPDERGQALLVRLIAHVTGYGKPPKEPWEK